jgi:phospholipid/cholesterol/gamma-HCH transport system ATP-binding protein
VEGSLAAYAARRRVTNDSPHGTPEAPSAADVIVDLRDVEYEIASRMILSGLDLAVRRGRITAIMGPSGAGKTTLLKLITAEVTPTRGRVLVFDQDLATLGRAQVFAIRKRMGMLFQNGALLTDMDVFENVAFPLREHTDLTEPLIRALVVAKLNAVGLRGAATLMPGELSGGMARRVALARAIVMDPEILIYDEPFVGLDPISRGVILRLIRQMNEGLGITSIVVSHDVQDLAQIADDSYLLSGGKVVAHGTPKELFASESVVVRQFMQGIADGPVPFHYPAPDVLTQLLVDEQ